MPRLSERQYRSLITGIGQIHACRSLSDFRATTMDVASDVIGADCVSFSELDTANESVLTQLRNAQQHQAFLPYLPAFEAHMHEHPLLQHFLKEPNAPPLRLSDFISARQLGALGLYKEVYCNIDTHYQLVAQLTVASEVVVGLAIGRSCSDFTDEDLLLVKLLDAHLHHAYTVCRRRDMVLALLEGRPTDELLDWLRTLGLTRREAEVCFYMLQSKSNAEIGELFEISPLTAKTHCERIFRKLEVSGRLHAIRHIIARLLKEI